MTHMHISQKKTCFGCLAFKPTLPINCSLNYKNGNITKDTLGFYDGIPFEPCPKPKTRTDMFRLPIDK